MKAIQRILLLTVAALSVGGASDARDLVVPREFKTVNQAVRAAAPQGDRVVVVDKGNYAETVKIDRDVSLVSDPAGARISNPNGSGVDITSGTRNVTIDGFLIEKCKGDGIRVDPGDDTSVTLVLLGTGVNSTIADADSVTRAKGVADAQLAQIRLSGLGTGVRFVSGTGNRLEIGAGSSFSGNPMYAIASWRPLDMRAKGARFSGNGAADFSRKGTIYLPEDSSIEIEECVIEGSLNQDAFLLQVDPVVTFSRGVRASIRVNRCAFVGNAKDGLHIDNRNHVPADFRVSVRNSLFQGSGKYGIDFDCGKAGNLTLSVSNSMFARNGRAAVYFKRFGDMKVDMQRVCAVENENEGVFFFSADAGRLVFDGDDLILARNGTKGFNMKNAKRFRVHIANSQIVGNQKAGFGFSVEPEVLLQEKDSKEKGSGFEQAAILTNSRLDGNGMGVWVCGAGVAATSVELTSCTVGENLGQGVDLTGATLVVEKTRIERNKGVGIVVGSGSSPAATGGKDLPPDKKKVVGLQSQSKIRVKQSSLQGNDLAAIRAFPLPAWIDLSGCEVAGNRGPGILLGDVFAVTNRPSGAWSKSDDRVTSAIVVSDSCAVRIADTGFLGNTSATLSLAAAAGVIGESPDLAQGDPSAVEPAPVSLLPSESENERAVVGRFRRYELIANLTRQAKAWWVIGKPERSRVTLADAERVWGSLEALASGGTAPCRQYLGLIEDCKAALKSSDSATSANFLAGDGENQASEQDIRNGMEKRARAYETLADFVMSLPEKPVVAVDSDKENARAVLIQSILDDFVCILLNERAEESRRRLALSLLGRCFDECMNKVFEDPADRVDALNWLDEQVRPIVAKPLPLSVAYEQFAVSQYKKGKSVAKETVHLELLTKLPVGPEERKLALSRLAQLYREFWKLPEKSVETEKKIVEAFPKTEDEYSARIAVAKDLYESKDYAKAIAELERLLSVLPKEYKDAPVRLLLGLSHLANGGYAEARDLFGRVVNTDQGEYKEKALYLLGYSYICEQKYDEAGRPFRDLVGLFPNGQYSERAKSFLSKMEQPK